MDIILGIFYVILYFFVIVPTGFKLLALIVRSISSGKYNYPYKIYTKCFFRHSLLDLSYGATIKRGYTYFQGHRFERIERVEDIGGTDFWICRDCGRIYSSKGSADIFDAWDTWEYRDKKNYKSWY